MDDFQVLAPILDKLIFDPQARMGYDMLAGGLYWSDEIPAWSFDGLEPGQYPPGFGQYRALLNYRSSLIYGEPREKFRELWEQALVLCPNWPGLLPSRRVPALADEYRKRADAAIRSWEELDARFEEQKKAQKQKLIA
ncbi:MAG TPA: hypothetical protein VE988_14935 [Gemmataceae bacterium]|nr:hypothetical protein [Gemmataceae bacterium]